MLQFRCPAKGCTSVQNTHLKLREHLKSKHGLLICKICQEHKKIFSFEMEVFSSRERLHDHFVKGNADDNVPAGTGVDFHPLCEFCDVRFYSVDELFVHLRDHHEECHVCKRRQRNTMTTSTAAIREQMQRDGNGSSASAGADLSTVSPAVKYAAATSAYFKNYRELESHFRNDHFYCEVKECKEKKFVVFDNEVDYKAHMMAEHKSMINKNDFQIDFRGSSNTSRGVSVSAARRAPSGFGGSLSVNRQNNSVNIGDRDDGFEVIEPPAQTPIPQQMDFPSLAELNIRAQQAQAMNPNSAPKEVVFPPLNPAEIFFYDYMSSKLQSVLDKNQSPENGMSQGEKEYILAQLLAEKVRNDPKKFKALRGHFTNYLTQSIPASDFVSIISSLVAVTRTERPEFKNMVCQVYPTWKNIRAKLEAAFDDYYSDGEIRKPITKPVPIAQKPRVEPEEETREEDTPAEPTPAQAPASRKKGKQKLSLSELHNSTLHNTSVMKPSSSAWVPKSAYPQEEASSKPQDLDLPQEEFPSLPKSGGRPIVWNPKNNNRSKKSFDAWNREQAVTDSITTLPSDEPLFEEVATQNKGKKGKKKVVLKFG